jgi:hypothetical protein
MVQQLFDLALASHRVDELLAVEICQPLFHRIATQVNQLKR